MSSIGLNPSRSKRIYRPSEPLDGKIVINSSSSMSHYGVHLNVNGSVNLQIRGGSAGVIESFYGVIKPITIVKQRIEVGPSGKIGSADLPKQPVSPEMVISYITQDTQRHPLLPELKKGLHDVEQWKTSGNSL